MAHEHAAHHDHDHAISSLNKAFIIGITLNVLFVVVEAVIGLAYDSMGLLSDAGHNLSDVAGLLLAMLAFRLAQAHATPRYTYGYKKSTVLISLLNSVILLIAVGVIVSQSIGRMLHPAAIEGAAIAWTAGFGVVVNGFTAWLFMKDRKKDLNVKGAYLHMAADALVSVGVVVSGVVIALTGWTIVDPIVGLVIAAIIVISVWSLTRDSLRLSLDGVPADLDAEAVVAAMCHVEGVAAVHHIHIWAISTTENALTAHVVLVDLNRLEPLKQELKMLLHGMNIHHVTLEMESPEAHCDDAHGGISGE
ncbi:MAG: cation diffusion facilitator family transporter [Alistipes sp.]